MTARQRRRFEIRRAYDALPAGRSYQVLVDRLWPRGVRKDEAALDEWAKDVAPSDGLRRWYGHEPEKFAEFAGRYRAELEESPARTSRNTAAPECSTSRVAVTSVTGRDAASPRKRVTTSWPGDSSSSAR